MTQPTSTAPPAAAKSAREIEISNWSPHEKNTLRGFFTIHLPNGMVIHDVMLHEKNDSRWIAFPAREYQDKGERRFARFIEFEDRSTSDRFRDQVLAALDKHFAEGRG